ncbi:hypothetical protein [Terasakiella sp.]|uniref:hypothetical protein n=1 Tax=Terasakiella sp. TaxID=2034861 RepID=UPI003AA8FE19
MDEILELRNRITDVEATLASNVDALTAAMGGAVMGAIITGAVGFLLFRLQQSAAVRLYELQKLEKLTDNLEDLRVMFGSFKSDVKHQNQGTGADTITSPSYNHFYAVPTNLGLDAKFDLKLKELNEKCKIVVGLGAQSFQSAGTNDSVKGYKLFEKHFYELQDAIDTAQNSISIAMKTISKKL